MEEVIVGLLRCPVCRRTLDENSGNCMQCDISFGAIDELPDYLPPGSADLKHQEREHYTEKIEYYLTMHKTWCGSPFYLHYHNAFLDDLRKLPKGSLILELGCGLGHDGMELLRSGYRVVESDIAPGELAEAKKMQADAGYAGSSYHLLADSEKLPFADNSFNGALMVSSLHHLPHPEAALAEVIRVLKPGGVFVMGTEPNTWQHQTIYPAGKIVLNLLYRMLGKATSAGANVSEADKETEGFSGKELDVLFTNAGFSHWELKSAGYLSAALFFLETELSELLGKNVKAFWLEKLLIPVDEMLSRIRLLRRFPWHWNTVAYK